MANAMDDRSRQYHEGSVRGGYMPTMPARRQEFQAPQEKPRTTGQTFHQAAQMLQDPAGFRQQQQEQQREQEQQQRIQERTEAPQNPWEALQYQFAGGEAAADEQRQYIQQALEAFGQAQQQSQQAYQESQARNEQLMREGLQQRMQEQEMVRQQNLEMMRQRQATLQHMFGMLRQGGEGSLAAFMSPMGSEMGQTYQMGMYTPQDYGGYYQGMMGGPDPSHQYTGAMAQLMGQQQVQQPDYSAWMDPEAHRTSWYLPPQTTVQQTMPTAPGAPPPQTTFQAPQTQPQGQPQQLYDWQRNPQEWANELNRFFGGQHFTP